MTLLIEKKTILAGGEDFDVPGLPGVRYVRNYLKHLAAFMVDQGHDHILVVVAPGGAQQLGCLWPTTDQIEALLESLERKVVVAIPIGRDFDPFGDISVRVYSTPERV